MKIFEGKAKCVAKSIHIPLPEDDAVALLGRVKPTAEMPRPGASKTSAKPKKKPAFQRAK